MKKILLLIIGIFFLTLQAYADDDFDYIKKYNEMPIPTHSYIHQIDPGQYFDMMNTTWSPYPSFRLVSPIYFKTITIQPGYYLLTPREYKGVWYILFKQAGKIVYIVPTYNRDIVPEFFYQNRLPKAKLSIGQKFQIKGLNWIGSHFDCAKRRPAPASYLEVTDLDNNYLSMVIYWGDFRYYTIFRTQKL